jgi:hypothetical protein
LSGNKIDGGTISDFASTGIDDNADANAITIDSSENVGIGQPTSIGAKLHVKSGASGATTEGYHNELTVESSTTGGISILTPNDATGGIVFGDPEDNVVGGVQYDHANNYLHLRAGSAQRFVVGSSGQFGIGTTPTYGTSGQVLTSGGASSAPSWAAAGGGKLIQFLKMENSTSTYITDETYQDTPLTLAITPASSSNIIVCMVTTAGRSHRPSTNDVGMLMRMYNSTDTYTVNEAKDTINGGSTNWDRNNIISLIGWDTGRSVATTYVLQICRAYSSGGCFVNLNGYRGTMILAEIEV